MAWNIPNVPSFGEALNQGVNTGSSMFARIMEPILKREQLAQQMKIHKDALALQQAAAGRAAALAPLNQKIAELKLAKAEREADPAKQTAYFQQLLHGIRSAHNEQNQGMPNQEIMQPFTGMGLPSLEEMEHPTVTAPTPDQLQQGGFNFTPEEQMALGMAGFKLPKQPTLTGAARDVESIEQLKQLHGADSPIVKKAEAIQQAEAQRHADLSEIRHRQLNGLKPGDTEIKDPNSGEVIGFRKQTDAKQKEAAKNTVLFNELYPLVYKGGAPFSGPGATLRLHNAVKAYKTDPRAKKLVDDFMISLKAAGNTTITEAARFSAGRTNQTYNRFLETIKTEDLNNKLKKWIKEFEIPPSANLRAGIEWQKILNKAEKKANSRIPATYDYYFDPETQFAHQNEQNQVANDNFSQMSDEELQAIVGAG